LALLGNGVEKGSRLTAVLSGYQSLGVLATL